MENRIVISGIGRSATGRRLFIDPLSLTLDACLAAITDAGLQPSDIDGLITWPGEGFVGQGFDSPGIIAVQDALRLSLNWYASGSEGLNLLGHVIDAAMAVASGTARHVLVYRTLTEATMQGAGRRPAIGRPGRTSGPMSWVLPFGARSAANWAALSAQLHFATYGTRPEQLGTVAVQQRSNASRNPYAIYRDPLSLDDYLGARMVSDPLRLYDCDVPADGSIAFVVSPREYGVDAPKPAIAIDAVSAARYGRAIWEQRDDMLTMAGHDAAASLWRRSSLRPSDVDVAQLYDGFSIFVLMWLEAAGFCAPGDSGAFIASGATGLGGTLPVNTAGGQLSEGRFIGS